MRANIRGRGELFMTPPRSLLFVCLGNICRSPMAEGIFIHHAKMRQVLENLAVDSCGLGSWHVGQSPDPRAIATCAKHGIELPSIARQFAPSTDIERFDLLLAMDETNAKTLEKRGAPRSKIRLMRSFDVAAEQLLDDQGQPTQTGAIDVPDPYYGGDDGFDQVFEMLTRACEGLLDQID